jgi:repressor LexA
MRSLTAQQQKILDFIRQTIDTAGFPPTRTEIARALDFRSPNAAESHLRALAKKGVIELLRGAARGIRLKESTGLPLIGRVAAGSPILAEAHV